MQSIKKLKILSFHNSLESSVVYFDNGVVKEAVSEERFNRVKNFRGMPKKSIDYIFSKYNINFKKLDFVISGIIDSKYPSEEVKKKLDEKLKVILREKKNKKFKKKYFERVNTEIKWNQKCLNEIISYSKENNFFNKLVLVDHHKSHAASAYFCSPFKNAKVFTFDGKGGFKSSSYYDARNSIFIEKDFNTTFESLGYFYGNITKALGFKAERHEGKITGLAAYGKKTKILDYFKSFIKFQNGKINISLSKDYMPWFCDKKDLPNFYLNINKYSKEDVAYAAQYILEDIVCKYIKFKIKNKKKVNVCLAGGVFANVKLNQKIREIKNVKNVYIQPAMSDAGLSIGSIFAFLNKKFQIKPEFLENVYLGSNAPSKIKTLKSLREKKVKFNQSKNISDVLIKEFKNKNIVGFFNGRMEFGPRSLCNRSILYHCKDKSINKWINEKLHRTEFMPFAPVTIEELAPRCFKGWKKEQRCAEFMTMTYSCTTEFKKNCPAAVHIDGTARPQIINKKNNIVMYKILKDYFKKTGDLAIINTSFNKHEEPIVENIEDAISALKQNVIDTLIIDKFVCKDKFI
jgi:carbamoyltransferase